MSDSRIYTPQTIMNAKALELAEEKRDQIEAQFNPGPFPIDAMSPTQRRIVESVANVYELPIELAAMPALAVIGAALGKAWKLTGAVNGRENFGNLYIIPGAPKSTGKGAAAQLAQPIVDASSKLIEDWKANEKPDLETKKLVLEARLKILIPCLAQRKDNGRLLPPSESQALETELRNANAEIERIKPFLTAAPSYHVGNATSEALATKFVRNGETLFALAYEGGDVLRVLLGKYSKGESADLDLWLSGYSVEPYQSDRVLRGNVNIIPCLTALIFCQPSLLRELYSNEEAFERGLTARLLPFICESSLQEDDGAERSVSVHHRQAWNDLISELLNQRRKVLASGAPAIVRCHPEARELFRDFHNESIKLRNGPCRDVEGELGRWRESGCRIGLGLCVADNPGASEMTKEQAERAVILARWAHRSALQVMHSGRMERRLGRANKLHDLVTRYDGQVTLRALEKSHGFPQDEVERLVLSFPALLRLETKQNPRGGPQSRILTTAQR
jgi:Protein of unknown function (DUF3987)